MSRRGRLAIAGAVIAFAAAVALAFEQRPDAVLLDVNMPRLDGISAAEIIREQLPEIRLLLQTGEPLDTVRDRAAELDFVIADKRDLRRTVEQLAQETGTRDAGRASAKPAAAAFAAHVVPQALR